MNITTAPCLELELFRRQAAALKRAHERLRSLGDHGEDVRLAWELGQLLLVDVVDSGVVGEETGARRGELVAADQPRDKALAMRADAGIGANGGEHVEKRGVALPVLLGEIADGRGKVPPGGRGVGELGAEGIRPAAKRQHGLVTVPAHHRRKLEEIADQHDL